MIDRLIPVTESLFNTFNLTYNKIGLYMDDAGAGASEFTATPYVPFTVYLVVTDPYNEFLAADISAVQGIEFRRSFARLDPVEALRSE